jgi:hypothetical protein
MRGERFVPVDLALVGVVDEMDVRSGISIRISSGVNSFT